MLSTASVMGLVFLAGRAPAETADQMLDERLAVYNARKPRDVFRRGEMVMFSASGDRRTMTIAQYHKLYTEEESKTILYVTAPADVKGMSVLSWNHPGTRADDQWIYLPDLKRVRRIASSNRREAVFGSDCTFEDFDLLMELEGWGSKEVEAKIVGEEEIDGVTATIIDLRPLKRTFAYDRLMLWVARKDWTLHRLDFFTPGATEPVKRAHFRGYRTIGVIPTFMQLEVASLDRGTKTQFNCEEAKYNQDLPDDAFSERAITRGGL
jgi:hypothetical protein